MSPDSAEQERREMRSIFVETGHKTLNALLLVSGGTTVTFLTFLGTAFKDCSVIGSIGEPATRGFVNSLQLFVSSVALCIVAYATTYVAHAFYHLGKESLGRALMYTTFVVGVSSIGAFVFGSVRAVGALHHALDTIKTMPPK